MSVELEGLATTVQKFKNSLQEVLKKDYEDFHKVLNGKDAIPFKGLDDIDGANEYLIDTSDILFWHDPTAYIEELGKWKVQVIDDKYNSVKDYLIDSDQVSTFDNFVKSIKKNRIAPFIGAGLSKPCGFPLWGEAVKNIIKKLESYSSGEEKSKKSALEYFDEVKDLVTKHRYFEAVELLHENHKGHLNKYIYNTFNLTGNTNIKGPIKLLPKITDGCIITTNFDKLIEQLFEDFNRPISGYMYGTQTQNQFASKLIQGERCILKLHGHYDSPETYIFSKKQYDLAYGEDKLDFTKPLAKALRQIFISHSLLFLGCSLEEDRTMDLFKNVVASKSFDIPNHYALLPKTMQSLEKEETLQEANIEPLWYEIVEDDQGNQDHSQLELMLEFAIDCVNGKARI